MSDSLKVIIEEMRLCAQFEADKNVQRGLRMWADRLEASGKPVAWMHEDPKRVDVIHTKVKDLLKSAGEFHRPLDKSEKYTIPLYAVPPQADLAVTNSELADVVLWLDEAAEDIESWAGYASSYFKEKHGLQSDIARYRDRAEKLRLMIAADEHTSDIQAAADGLTQVPLE